MRSRPSRCFLLFVLAAISPDAFSQSASVIPREDVQIWTDFHFAHSLRENTDLSLSGGLRMGRDVSHLVYERLGAGLSFKFGKYVTLFPSYAYFATQPAAGLDSHENRLTLDTGLGLPHGRWEFTDRNIFERRFRDPKDSTRYRNRLQIERAVTLAGMPLSLFVWDEVLYDWSFNAWVRNRIAIGGGRRLSSKVSIELYYLRQNGSLILPADMHVVGMTLRTRI
jgi:hypothetical protein